MIKVGTFFSGVGSPEQALINLGIEHEIEFACDIDKYARQTYLKNFDCKNMYDDITSLNMKDLSPVDLLVFGFPCQAFSMAGKRGGFDDTRGTLFYDALRYLQEHRPRYFIAENVKGLISHDNRKTFRTILDCLSKTENYQFQLSPFDNLGYHVHYKVLNTKDFGVPQNRERIFIVGIRDDADNNFTFPKPFDLENKLKDVLENDVDDKYYLSNQRIKTLQNNPRSIGFTDKNNKHFANCLIASYSKLPTDGEYISDDLIISHSLHPRSGDPTKGGTGNLSKQDGTSYCLDTGNAQAVEIKGAALRGRGHGKELEIRKDDLANSITTVQTDSIIKHDKINRLPDLKLKVSKRVNDTPKKINQYLKDNKKGTLKEISVCLDLPKTQVEHYFRTDNSRAIPSPKVWLKLKKLLQFDDKYDKQVTEINESIGTYESASRLYSDNGLSPTLQTNEQGFYKTQNRIRRLTPIECERLQGFPDNHTEGVSDTQRYRQMGNSITVNVMMELFKKLLK